MKIIYLLGLVISSMTVTISSQAAADEVVIDQPALLVSYKVRLPLSNDMNKEATAFVSIDQNGSTKIAIDEYESMQYFSPSASYSIEIQLTETVASAVKSTVINLSDAKTSTFTAGIVCSVQPHPMLFNPLIIARDYDQNKKEFTSAAETIESSQGCWVVKKINLKNNWDKMESNRLKGIILSIAAAAFDQH